MPGATHSAEDLATLITYAKECAGRLLHQADAYAGWQLNALRRSNAARDETRAAHAGDEYVAATRATVFTFARICDEATRLLGEAEPASADDLVALQTWFDTAWDAFTHEWNLHLSRFKESMVQEHVFDHVQTYDRAVDGAFGMGDANAWILNASSVDELTANVRTLAAAYASEVEQVQDTARSRVEEITIDWHDFDRFKTELSLSTGTP
ncbi:hypothetical protein [Streptomyces sp. NPDC001594]|uniref:hypothetical protein n=1 Tax=Streptomyces sp. NPDC001594 TaxID=3364590 RepID=UPI0036B8A899